MPGNHDVDWRLARSQAAKGTTRPDDARAARLAGRQNGVIATRQLADCGLGSDAITARVRRAGLHPVFCGVYAVGHAALTQTGYFTAAVLACGDGAVLSHHAAAAYHGMLGWRGRPVEVIVPRCAGRKIDGIRPHRSALDPRDALAVDLLDGAGIQRPDVNPRLRLDERVICPDLLFRERLLAIELDSRRWHSDPLTQQDDADKQAILEAHGYRVLRITFWQIVDDPRRTIARVRAALAAGA